MQSRRFEAGEWNVKSRCVWMVLLVPVLAWGCVAQTRWTPKSVSPPAAAQAGVEVAPSLGERAELVKGPEAPGPEESVPLTRDGALLTALKNNRGIDAARLGPQIDATFVPEARAVFDPVLLGTASTGHNTQRVTAPSTLTTTGTGSSAATTIPTTTIQLLTQIRQLASALNQSDYRGVTSENSNASLTLQNYLPTGTKLFLTGAVSAAYVSGSGSDHEGSWTLGVDQALLKNAGLAVNLVALNQAKNRSAQSAHVFRAAVLDTIRQVETTYWELVLAKELLKIRQFAVTLAEEQRKRNEDYLEVGRAIEGDVMTAQAEKASRMADVVDAEAAIRTQNLALIRLMNPDNAKKWSLSFEPAEPAEVVQVDLNIEASEKLALQYRPEMAQARLDLANLDLSLASAKNDLLPTLDLTASYGRVSSGAKRADTTRFLDDGDFDNYQVGLSLTAPLLNRAERARYRRAKLANQQGERTLGNLELSITTETRQAAVEVRRQWERITADQEAVRSRTEELRIAQGRYEVGRTTNLDLLLVQRDFIQAQIAEISSRVRYIEALTAFYAAEGTLLERRGIFLDSEKEQ